MSTTPFSRPCVAVALLFSTGLCSAQSRTESVTPKSYELRIYSASPGKLAALQTSFRDQILPLISKHHIENIFNGTVLEGARSDGPDAANMFIAILAHRDRAAAEAAWAAIDGTMQNPVQLAKPVTSIFMSPADFSPDLEAHTNAGRIFELRKYNTGPGALPRTLEQFRSGLAAILFKNGMTPIAYWTSDDRSSFIYLLAHKDREAARSSWSTFMNDYRPFMAAFNDRVPAVPGPRTPDENRFIVPTDFSPRR